MAAVFSDPAVWVALLALYGLGSCFAMLGSLSVKLMPRLNIDAARFGSLVSSFMGAALISSLVVGVVLDQVGFKSVALVGFIAVTAVILLLAQAKTYNSVLVAAVLLGVAAMALNTTGNTMIGKVLTGVDQAAATNLGNVFFGLGLFVTPLLTSTLFKKTSYEVAVSSLALIMAIGIVLSFVATLPEPDPGFTFADALGLVAEPTVIVTALLLFCYISLEGSLTNWLAPYGKEVLKRTNARLNDADLDANASQLLTIFAIAMMLGRLTAGIVPGLTGIDLTQAGPYVIAAVALASAVVILMMVGTTSVGQAKTMAFLAGFFFAPIFPTAVGVLFAQLGAKEVAGAGSAFGLVFAVGLFGGTIIPKAIGNRATGSSIQKSLRILMPLAIILAVLALAYLMTAPEVVATPDAMPALPTE